VIRTRLGMLGDEACHLRIAVAQLLFNLREAIPRVGTRGRQRGNQ